MPITVQHGIPGSPGLAGLAQAAMQIQAQKEIAAMTASIPSIASGGGGGGGSRRKGSSAAADERAAYKLSQVEERARDQESDNAIREAQEEQRLKEKGFKYEYTETARQELAQINNSRQRVKSSEDFSTEEQAIMLRELDFKEFGIQKSAVPADRNEMKFPPNQAQSLNETWTSEGGDLMAYTAKGEPIVRQDYKDTKPGIQSQWDYEQRQEINKFMMNIVTEEIRDPETGNLRLRRPDETRQVRENIEAGLGISEEETPGEETPGRGDIIFQQMAEEQATAEQAAEQQAGYTGLAEQLGIQPNEKEQNLPGDVGAMFSILRTVDERYTGKNGKIDLSGAPLDLIQNIEIMEQRAASWLAGEQLDRNRQPIPKKKRGFKGLKPYGSSVYTG